MTTFAVVSDLHSGDSFGLANPANVSKRSKACARLLFNWYGKTIQKIGPVDFIIAPGELTEGPGRKSTIELWTSDLEEQSETCAELLAMWPCEDYYLCYSSKYHSGDEMRTDHNVVNHLKLYHNRNAKIHATWRLDIEGVKVNAFHHVGGSSTAYGFASQLMKTAATDVVRGWYRGFQPAALYFRGHTHIYGFAGNDKTCVYNCPSLKWPLGEYGNKLDRPYYAMGILEVRVDGSDWSITPHLFNFVLPEEEYVKVA